MYYLSRHGSHGFHFFCGRLRRFSRWRWWRGIFILLFGIAREHGMLPPRRRSRRNLSLKWGWRGLQPLRLLLLPTWFYLYQGDLITWLLWVFWLPVFCTYQDFSRNQQIPVLLACSNQAQQHLKTSHSFFVWRQKPSSVPATSDKCWSLSLPWLLYSFSRFEWRKQPWRRLIWSLRWWWGGSTWFRSYRCIRR